MITLAYLSEYKEKNLYKGNSLDEDSPRMLLEKCRKQFTRPYQLLLIPILAQGGLISSLAFSDWNKVTIVTEISHSRIQFTFEQHVCAIDLKIINYHMYCIAVICSLCLGTEYGGTSGFT